MRYLSGDVGSFLLADKADGRAFTDEDDELLTLFASQAAAAIANAAILHDEHRASAGFEALVETSLIGVMMLDAESAGVVSLNREAGHIAERLRIPGSSLDQLLEVMSLYRTDCSEISQGEFPIAQQFGIAERCAARMKRSRGRPGGARESCSLPHPSPSQGTASARWWRRCRTWRR